MESPWLHRMLADAKFAKYEWVFSKVLLAAIYSQEGLKEQAIARLEEIEVYYPEWEKTKPLTISEQTFSYDLLNSSAAEIRNYSETKGLAERLLKSHGLQIKDAFGK
jgi:hypothetical protein